MFKDGHKDTCVGKGEKHYKDIGSWNRRESPLRMSCAGYVDHREISDIPLLRHGEKRNFVWFVLALLRRFGKGVRFVPLDLCFVDRSSYPFYVGPNAKHWWRELDCEVCQRRSSQNALMQECHN